MPKPVSDNLIPIRESSLEAYRVDMNELIRENDLLRATVDRVRAVVDVMDDHTTTRPAADFVPDLRATLGGDG